MVRPRDQETIATEKMVYCSQFPGRGPATPYGHTRGSTRVSQEPEDRGETVGSSLYWGFPRKKRSGRVSRFRFG